MNKNYTANLHAKMFALLFVLIQTLGCTSTPQHTNVLIFGTNTKVALDVSQDPVAGVGVTLGYKRQEAVWMPLLPNQQSGEGDKLKPATCTDATSCPKFIGIDELKQMDTYSVLASFGSKLDAGVDSQGKEVKVKGQIAQYFATGLAARLLAQNGGAGLVNTNHEDPLTTRERKEVQEQSKIRATEIEELMTILTDKKDPQKVDVTKLKLAFDKKPGKDIPETRRNRILAIEQIAELREALGDYAYMSVVKPMYDTLNAK